MARGSEDADCREANHLRTSVVIVTLDRPLHLRACLNALGAQDPSPTEIIVVDASDNRDSADVVSEWAAVTYLRHDGGAGKMTTSRNIGLEHATGDIVAFIDDDAYVHPGWLEQITTSFRDGVGAVGGRAINPGQHPSSDSDAEIGRLTAEGEILGNFDRDPGHEVKVDHLIGCNMAFRRDLLLSLGGLRDDYPGTALREESDLCIRVGHAGRSLIFNPKAVVTHVGAPQVKGRRFDLRYTYYAQRNHCQFLVRNFGARAPIFRRFVRRTCRDQASEAAQRLRAGRWHAALGRPAIVAAGTVIGTVHGLWIAQHSHRP